MHRFFLYPDKIKEDHVLFPSPQAHQILRVLRMKAGDQVIVFPNNGWQYQVELCLPEKERLIGNIIQKDFENFRPEIQIFVYLSPLKRENFIWAIQKCTEVGVFKFIPTIYTRTIIKSVPGSRLVNRWNRIVEEATEQCGRRYIPEIAGLMPFEEALKNSSRHDITIILWEGEQTNKINHLTSQIKSGMTIGLFVGPEGGIGPEEILRAKSINAEVVTLGEYILRSETAAVVGSSHLLQFS